MALCVELNDLLSRAGMCLRKCRSNSSTLMNAIPKELQEKTGLSITSALPQGPFSTIGETLMLCQYICLSLYWSCSL